MESETKSWKDSPLISKIDSRIRAERAITEAFWSGLVIAGLSLVIGIILLFLDNKLGYNILFEAIVILIITLLFRFVNSRVTAVIYFLYASISVLVTMLGRLGFIEGGSNIWLAIFFWIATFAGLRARFYLHKNKI